MTTLHLAGTYRRTVRASLVRVWENVLDWEHLPSLHADTFQAVELIEKTARGWKIRVVNQPGGAKRMQVLSLTTDRRAGKYCVRTIDGAGAGSEIRTVLTPKSADKTAIAVSFHILEADPGRLKRIGATYRAVYKRLWDEDEVMMRGRERALREKRTTRRPTSMAIGTLADVRARLPFSVRLAGQRFRILELGGRIVAFNATCPHWLGPLEDAPIEDGCVRCPWHGYRFDVVSGLSADGHRLKLAKAPRVTIKDNNVVLAYA